jgi:ACS family hexuronate transporter-like MFS transporter
VSRPPWRRLPLRWQIAVLLFLATTINYIDRQSISVAAPVLSREFGFSATDYSWIVFSFLLAYAVMQVVAGGLIDRIGSRTGFAVAITGWSIANMAHAMGSTVLGFSVLRGVLGAFEAANYPAALKVIAEWFPRRERAAAVGLVNVGPGLGAVLAPPLVSWLIVYHGWRQAFIVTGAIGFVWLVAWLRLFHTPDRHPRLSAEEAELIRAEEDQSAAAAPPLPWATLFRDRRMWGLITSRFVSDGAFYFFVFWLPKYLADVRGFGIVQIGAFAWIPFVAADAGALVGGWACGRLIACGYSLDASRKIVIWAGAALAALALPAATASTPQAALAYIAAAMFGIQVKASSLFTLPADIYPARSVALAWGIQGAAGSVGGMLFQLYIGAMVDGLGYTPVFWVAAAMHLVSAAFVMMLIPRIEPPRSSASGSLRPS